MNTISRVIRRCDLFARWVGPPVYVPAATGAVRDEIQFYATGARPIWLAKWALSR